MISGLAGYAVSLMPHDVFEWSRPVFLLLGLYFVSSGSFALNQAQEWRFDQLMQRTATRPVPKGAISPWQAYVLGFTYCIFGIGLLAMISMQSAFWAGMTVILYNGLYTLYWKKKWIFGAVPGAIPGAMPVVIGYVANSPSVLEPRCLYLFLIMFLWQMPHFWALAVRYKDDYAKGGFPVMPTRIGVERTLYHLGLYTFTYVGVALAAPFFVETYFLYIALVVPLALKVLWEFFSYFRSAGNKNWLPFFLWTNLSMLAFICVPVFDRWLMTYLRS